MDNGERNKYIVDEKDLLSMIKKEKKLLTLLKKVDDLLESCNQIHSGSPIHKRIKEVIND